MSINCQQQSIASYKTKVYISVLFTGMKKDNTDIPLFMNIWLEKREVMKFHCFQRIVCFDSIQGTGPLPHNDVPFPVNTLGRRGRVRGGTGRP